MSVVIRGARSTKELRRLTVLMMVCLPSWAGAAPHQVDFAEEIRPIFNKSCVACHGGVKRAGKISFIDRASVVAESPAAEKPIIPGDPDNSEVMYRLTTADEEERMPLAEHGPRLTPAEINLVREWIRQGAPWKEHWAWVKPAAQSLPRVAQPKWPRQPLDHFILSRLEAERLQPAGEADRPQWLRRVTFDLIGLPPTPEEIRLFGADRARDAYERVVDRLLASPRFGERWAAPWLDLARYADSMGYERDPLRTIWPYRDWVIRAMNADMPFDEFTIRQLAGDLLPEATLPDQVAATFHRNTQVNTEGGTDDEEFRVAATLDRVNTTWQVWQATTMGCTQCHSHPYEPIRHDEYFQALAIFNTTRDWDLRDELPVLRVPLAEKDNAAASDLDRLISRLRREEFDFVNQWARQKETWQPLTPDQVSATLGTKLTINPNRVGGADVVTTGTVAANTEFTVEIPLPDHLSRLGALRVDVLPENEAQARHTPEPGFAITELKLAWLSGTTPAESPVAKDLTLAHCFGDEAEPIFDDDSAIRPDKPGWGAYPRLTHPRHAVFVPAEYEVVPAGARLRVRIAHALGGGDMPAQVTRRLRFSATGQDDWVKLLASGEFQEQRTQLAGLRERRAAIPTVALPAMAEQDRALQRTTAVFDRGNWLNKTDVVQPGVPRLHGKLPDGEEGNRLTLARWLVSDANPLTARVAVNRIWEQIFGTGIVETVEDFGSSGAKPSHPELLDFLALRFRDDLNWHLKPLLRELVLSATYRQDARTQADLLERDPRNRLLARGPRTRLSAEMVRDHALAASGLLSDKMFGPPVMPAQPDGIWSVAYSKEQWTPSAGEDRHRRAVYTVVRRTAGYPSLLTFDQPSREICVARRLRTNTPLQALVTLNDPVYVECAVALARRMRQEGGEDLRKQIARGCELATGLPPERKSLGALVRLHQRALARYQREPALAEKLAATPAEAALTLVANAILNLDRTLTK